MQKIISIKEKEYLNVFSYSSKMQMDFSILCRILLH